MNSTQAWFAALRGTIYEAAAPDPVAGVPLWADHLGQILAWGTSKAAGLSDETVDMGFAQIEQSLGPEVAVALRWAQTANLETVNRQNYGPARWWYTNACIRADRPELAMPLSRAEAAAAAYLSILSAAVSPATGTSAIAQARDPVALDPSAYRDSLTLRWPSHIPGVWSGVAAALQDQAARGLCLAYDGTPLLNCMGHHPVYSVPEVAMYLTPRDQTWRYEETASHLSMGLRLRMPVYRHGVYFPPNVPRCLELYVAQGMSTLLTPGKATSKARRAARDLHKAAHVLDIRTQGFVTLADRAAQHQLAQWHQHALSAGTPTPNTWSLWRVNLPPPPPPPWCLAAGS